MVVGCLELTLLMLAPGSLKDKRSVVKRCIDKVKHRFHVSVAEVDLNDETTRACIGIALVTNDGRFANSVLDKILDYIEDDLVGLADVVDHRLEVLHV